MSETEPTPPWTPYPGPRPAPYRSDVPQAAEPARPLLEPADYWTALLGTLALLPLGVFAALIWVALAPRATASVTASHQVSIVGSEPRAFVAADMTFLFIAVVAGVLCGGIAMLLGRHRGTAVAVAMAAGGVGASYLMSWLGMWISGGPAHRWAAEATAGTHHYFLQLQAQPFLMAWPLIAVLVVLVVSVVTEKR
ncbi:MAG: hypothetical protein IRZ02_01800 [Acidothermus sp.]|nr:hypothetical protein [Acidothermus sp.]MCL6537747.1 hypothetical protein [Acidothermus sp.]